MTQFYAEIYEHGRWTPMLFTMKPGVRDGRLLTRHGMGSEIRNVQAVPDHLSRATLGQIWEELKTNG